MRLFLIEFLICIYMVINVELLFIHRSAINMSFFGKMSIQVFRPFSNLIVFLLLICRSSLYFFMLIVSQIYVLQTFSTILDVAFSFYPRLPEVKWLGGKESACQSRGMDLIPGSGRFPGQVNSIPLQYSCLENPMDRGAWRATVHGVAKSWTWLKQLSIHACRHN